MPAPETSGLNQTAVLWEVQVDDLGQTRHDEEGQPTVADEPEEIPVQWTWDQREVRDANGLLLRIEATVVVDRPVRMDSIMGLGTLIDWGYLGTGDTTEAGPLLKVVRSMEVPDIRGVERYRELMLARYKNVLPTVDNAV